jgi:ubiquinone biosynthesis protein
VLGHTLESLQRGELHVRFDVQHFEKLVQQLTRASYTLTAGIIIAGLLVGSSLTLRAGTGLATLGTIGYIAAGVLGLWLLWNILRGR